MTRERLYLYDTTLRDGQQSQGVDFSVEDKVRIAAALDGLGIDYVEGGWPGANPTDSAFFEAAPGLGQARLAAFGMTKRAGRSAANDEVLAGVVNAGTPAVCLVGKTHEFHVRTALEVPLEENLANIAPVGGASAWRWGGRRSSTRSISSTAGGPNPDYALACLQAALEAGARWVVLCDTNGGTLPAEVGAVTARGDRGRRAGGAARDPYPRRHRQRGGGDARGGRRRGAAGAGDAERAGERCGNANLASLIPTLLLKEPYASAVRDRRRAGGAAGADAGQPAARRHPEPGAGPGGALCRGLGLHPQGGAACERDPEGPGDLRARAARGGGQCPRHPDVEPGRAVEPARAAGEGRDRGGAGDPRLGGDPGRGEGARGPRLRLRRRLGELRDPGAARCWA